MRLQRNNWSPALASLLVMLLLLGQVTTWMPVASAGARKAKPAAAPAGPIDENDIPFKLDYTLTAGEAPAQSAVEPSSTHHQGAAPKVEPLPDADADALFASAPPMTGAQLASFSLPPQTVPPPTAAKFSNVPFPPTGGAPAPATLESVPLMLLNKHPQGPVDDAKELAFSFSQPMVALSTHSALKDLPAVATIMPAVKGEWKWLGTQTAAFKCAAVRFPMSTTYTVTVPAGTKSVHGATLKDAQSWTFTTALPRIKHLIPNDGETVRPSQLIAIVFNQHVQPAAIAKLTKLSVNGAVQEVRLATDEELAKAKDTRDALSGYEPGNIVVLKPVSALPLNAKVTVTVGPKLPSLEGPLVSEKKEQFTFRTFGPFVMLPAKSKSAIGEDESIVVQFSNDLDNNVDANTVVSFNPKVDYNCWMSGSELNITPTDAHCGSYTMTFSAKLRDRFGQRLTGIKTRIVNFGRKKPQLAFYKSGIEAGLTSRRVFPSGYPAILDVQSTNVPAIKFDVYQVDPTQYSSFGEEKGEVDNILRSARLIGTKTITVPTKPDVQSTVNINMAPWLKNGRGQLLVAAVPRVKNAATKYCWVQSSSLGMNFYYTRNEAFAWVSDINSGAPMPGVRVSMPRSELAGVTDGTGFVKLEAHNGLRDLPREIVVATKNDDSLVVMADEYGKIGDEPGKSKLLWYCVSDRSPYKPGEVAHVKGIVRMLRQSPTADLESVLPVGRVVEYEIKDYRGSKIADGTTELNQFGAFDLQFTFPKYMELGPSSVHLQIKKTEETVDPDDRSFSFEVGVFEFWRPEFEMKVSNVGQPIHLIGTSAHLCAEAKYYAGGVLQNAPVEWITSSKSGAYTPPGWRKYSFNNVLYPYLADYFDSATDLPPPDLPPPPYVGSGFSGPSDYTFKGKTDNRGVHFVKLNFKKVRPYEPTTVSVQATVQDVNRQSWSSRTELLVHPSSLYVGMKTDNTYCEKGKDFPISLVVTDIDGKVVPGVEMQLTWWRVGTADQQKHDVHQARLVSTAVPIARKLQISDAGLYVVQAIVADTAGRKNYVRTSFWVAGDVTPVSSDYRVPLNLLLLPKSTTCHVGDTASILVQSPFAPAEGLATIWRNGMARKYSFRMTQKTYTLSFPVTEQDIPGLSVQVDVVGKDRSLDGQRTIPSEASKSLYISVSTDSRELKVNATPSAKETKPGEELAVDVDVKDFADRAEQDAEVTVAVVDEALLALDSYRFANPLGSLYPKPDIEHSTVRVREELDLKQLMRDLKLKAKTQPTAPRPEVAALPAPNLPPPALPSGDLGAPGAPAANAPPPPPPSVEAVSFRSDFSPLANWTASAHTDASGHARVNFKLPDNLTRYRIMVIAAAGDRKFGLGESTFVAHLPLMVRPSAPRFLNYGDTFELPVVLHNKTDQDVQVSMAARAANAKFTAGHGRRCLVPANDRVEVRLPCSTVGSGEARFQFVAASSQNSDATELTIPVYTPATTEAFATYGEVDDGSVAQKVQVPSDVIPGYGSLTVTTSSTALQTLTDALVYLVKYPYECSEQISSRLISVCLMKDVLRAFNNSELPSENALSQSNEDDISKLLSRWRPDGSFGLWKEDDKDTYPYVCLHVTHALVRAQQAGYKVSDDKLSEALYFLKSIDRHIDSTYSAESKLQLQAFALYVRALASDADVKEAISLLKQKELVDHDPANLAMILYVLNQSKSPPHDEIGRIRSFFNNRLNETSSTAEYMIDDRYSDYRLFSSPARTNAIILDSLIADGTTPELVPKLLKSLLAGRRKGRWYTTQENVFSLIAVRDYFNRYEKLEPDFTAQAWLGKDFLGAAEFKGRSSDFKRIVVPAPYLEKMPGTHDLIVSKQGAGRLYYRLALDYAPKNLRLDSLERGFEVSRTYESVGKNNSVRRDTLGRLHFKAGQLVRVRLRARTQASREFVALVDPLPAGAECLNEQLEGAEQTAPEYINDSNIPYWARTYTNWNHENKRDNRVEVFSDWMPSGDHSYSYVMRATTPGVFMVPPTKAEEMYQPETFGRSSSETVIIE